MAEKPKRKRAANLTQLEKTVLVDLCTKYSSTIDDKRTDGSTVAMKEQAWRLLAEEFRATSTTSVERDWLQLKHVRNYLERCLMNE